MDSEENRASKLIKIDHLSQEQNCITKSRTESSLKENTKLDLQSGQENQKKTDYSSAIEEGVNDNQNPIKDELGQLTQETEEITYNHDQSYNFSGENQQIIISNDQTTTISVDNFQITTNHKLAAILSEENNQFTTNHDQGFKISERNEKTIDNASDTAVGKNQQKCQYVEEDQVGSALQRLIPHLGNITKFRKASKLLRQLMQEGKLGTQHGELLFQGLCTSMADKESSNDAQLSLEYKRLFRTAANYKYLFTSKQRKQLEALSIWAVYRTDLSTTDDSFKFNKIISTLKKQVSELPIFGEIKEEQQSEKNVDTDDKDVHLSMLQEGLLDCAEAARLRHRLMWAKTSVEMLITHIHQNRNRFAQKYQSKIDELWRFVRRSQVQSSVVQKKRERTTFEEARDRYAQSQISHRGKVGSEGDRKAEAWLG